MKIGCFSVLFGGKSLAEACKIIAEVGCEMVEIGAGNYPGDAHCNPKVLLEDSAALAAFKKTIADAGLEISALSCHGNPLHPNPEIANAHHETHRRVVQLAHKLEINTVVNFSGCPGEGPGAKYPNWVTCAWPPDFETIVKWQWDEVVIPYWKRESAFAAEHGINVAFEMHPGFVVYNTGTLLRLRAECGNNLGANFDPSHLFWQGMDPLKCLRALKGAIYHVHAKDCALDDANVAVDGVLDYKPYGDEINRSWIFRTVGYGHGLHWWKQFCSELRLVGYDHVLSIEHEDSLMAFDEGLKSAFATLREAYIAKKPDELFWA
jgi:sugar phosphate isomerase/epimerase